MSNFRRAYVPGACYFFTVVTHGRRPIFTNAKRVESLRAALRKEMQRRAFQIDAFVVLPDHLHTIWRLPEDDADFSSRWREIKKSVTRSLVTEFNGNIWQRRFWEHVIRDEEDWRRHMDYVHYNPVKHGLVSSPKDWEYSSFKSSVKKGWYGVDWGAASIPDDVKGMELE